ncbi:MAG: ketoacid-CoA transferase [Desulfobulbaceae bacterium]|nr:ketoacid-CoA transferase [Desulfobulbaceae bacterium]
MTIAAARQIPDGSIIFCGTGISMVAAMAAKHINAPNSSIFFETGAIDSALEELPLAVADPRVMYYTAVNGSLSDAFAYMQNRKTGKQVVGIMGAAQIDCYGNLNSTVIGDYYEPKVRFSGSGGASDVASFVEDSIIFMQHEKRKFVKKLDYLTSPGWLDGAGGRERAGLAGKGPSKVITNMAIMGFDETTKEMVLESYYPGITPEQILENMAFEVDVSGATELQPPTSEEVRVLREKCDPQGLII